MSITVDRPGLDDLRPFGSVRAGSPADAIDGVVPATVVAPETAEHLAAVLGRAAAARMTTVVRGGGTKLEWGRAPRPIELVIDTTRLDRLVAHRHGDLTATFQAGARLQQANAQLAAERQWLPVDSAFDTATIGGIIATNDSGPLRTRYGTPRDLLIGITLALTDGRLVKAGGHVVKNVAGYDLGRLMSGSFGELAVIVDATFKLLPIPAASTTVMVRYPDPAMLCDDVVRLAGSQLEPTALDVRASLRGASEAAYTLLVRFATSPEATAAQVEGAAALLASRTRETLDGAAEAEIWRDQVRAPWQTPGTVLRFSWLPADLPQVLALLREVGSLASGAVELTARALIGAGFLRVEGDDDEIARIVERLRSPGPIANVVVLRMRPALKARVDPWGPPVSAAAAIRALKQTFDPAGILNAGRGPI